MLGQFHQQLAGFVPDGEHHLGYTAYDAARRRDLQWHLTVLDTLAAKSKSVSDDQAQKLLRSIENKRNGIEEAYVSIG